MNDLFALLLIPARGGSKGIPRKNLIDIGGKPLLAWSIDSAFQCSLPHLVAVSTDDEEIGSIADSLGAQFIKRPEHLATDASITEETMSHCLGTLIVQHSFSHIVLLQPTCPIRRHHLLDQAFDQLLSDNSDSLVGVIRESPFMWSGPLSQGTPKYDVANRPMRQSFLEENFYYRETGNLYITSVDAFMKSGIRVSGKTSLFLLNEDEAIDIDTLDDVARASVILKGPES